MQVTAQSRFWYPAALRGWPAVAILFAGLAFRLFWAVSRHVGTATGEAAYVAAAIGSGRGFADAFVPGQGATAHLLPVTPLIAGGVYRVFGVYSATSEALLLLWSLALVFGCYLLYARCFELLGSPRRAVLAGWAAAILLPIYTSFEVFDFRVWEGGLGLLVATVPLLLVLAAESGRRIPRLELWLAVLPGLAFFINPPMGLAAMLMLGVWFWRRRGRARPGRVLLGLLLTLAALIGPWTVRNWQVMGEPIWLRDNFGLELAMGNFPAALGDRPFNELFDERLDAIHPRDNPAVFRRLKAAGGEAAYARRMGRETSRWMAAHPAETARLWLKHAREMLFTRTWMFATQHGVWMPVFRSTCITVLALLALPGLAWGIARDRRFLYLLPYIAVPFACYLPFQPVERYTWLIYPLLAQLAGYFVARVGTALRRHHPHERQPIDRVALPG